MTTFTFAPLVPLGVTTVSVPVREMVMWVPALPPKVTDFTRTKLAPLIVTLVPPLWVPFAGEIDVI